MKGIILAGGEGTRLNPITIPFSKQLVPIYDKPLIYYPLSTLMELNIKDILIITKSNQINNFKRLFLNGNQLGLNISYAIQDSPRGIAEAFLISEKFIKDCSVTLILGDNIFYGQNLYNEISNKDFNKGGVIFLYEVQNPSQYGVANIANERIINIIEKPKNPKSSLAVTGLYIYNKKIVDVAKSITLSKRNELEITDINNIYNKKFKLDFVKLKSTSVWFDAGTPNSLLQSAQYIQAIQERNNILVSSPEEVALRKKFISKNEFKKLVNKMPDSLYRQSLKKLHIGN